MEGSDDGIGWEKLQLHTALTFPAHKLGRALVPFES